MKIARRKRAQAGNWVFNPGNAEMCVSNRVEQFPAGYFRAGSASQAAEAPEAAGPKCCAERATAPRSIDRPHERTQTRALNERGPLGPGGGNGRHDRTPLFAQSKGDFRPKKTLSKS